MSALTKSWLPAYLGASIIWGFSFIFIEILLKSMDPIQVVFARVSTGACVLEVLALLRKEKFPFHLWKPLFIVGLLGNSLSGFMFGVAQDQISSVLASIINGSTPLFTLLILMLFYKEQKVTIYQILGLALGFVGVLVTLGAWQGIPQSQLIGVLAVLVAVVGYGIAIPFNKKHVVSKGLPPVSLVALQLVIATLQLVPFVLLDLSPRAEFTSMTYLIILLIGAFGSGFAYVFMNHVVNLAGAAIASTVTYATVLVAGFAGIVFLREELHFYEPIGAAIVIAGVILSKKMPKEVTL